MKRRPNPTLVGAFVVGGLLLAVVAVVVAAGGSPFARTERAVMHFEGSIYGLQVGAPVVFRGVAVGHVAAIGIVHDAERNEFLIPVVAELERDAVRGRGGAAGVTLPALVAQGLRAQLAMQSLLTGQLYVDLDLRPERPARLRNLDPREVEIPTSPSAIQDLKAQLEGVDFKRLFDDLSAIAASARAVAGGPELRRALVDVAAAAAGVRTVAERLDRQADPLLRDVRRSAVALGQAAERFGTTADRVGATAERFGTAADRLGALAAPDSALVASVQRSADEVARTAAALRRHTGDDALLVRRLDDALADLSRAARAVRELALTLEQQPDAVWRGRAREAADGGR